MSFQRNQDNANVTSPDWSVQAIKSMAFNAKPNSGAVGTATLFSVTGAVMLRIFGKITTAFNATSASVSPSASASSSASPSSSVSSSTSSSISPSVSPSSSQSPSASASGSPSSSISSSVSPSVSPSGSASPSASTSPSASVSPSSSSSASVSPSSSISPSSSLSPSTSVSPSISPSSSTSPSASGSPSSSASPSLSSGSTQGSVAVGTATNPTALINTTPVYLLQPANRIWVDNTPTTTAEPITSIPQYVVTEDVIQTVSTEAIGAGAIDYYVMWYPLSTDSKLVAA